MEMFLSAFLNIMVKCVALLHLIQEVMGSNLSPGSGCIEVLCGFQQTFKVNARGNISYHAVTSPFYVLYNFSFITHTIFQYFVV
jgi:hypothetical protein